MNGTHRNNYTTDTSVITDKGIIFPYRLTRQLIRIFCAVTIFLTKDQGRVLFGKIGLYDFAHHEAPIAQW